MGCGHETPLKKGFYTYVQIPPASRIFRPNFFFSKNPNVGGLLIGPHSKPFALPNKSQIQTGLQDSRWPPETFKFGVSMWACPSVSAGDDFKFYPGQVSIGALKLLDWKFQGKNTTTLFLTDWPAGIEPSR